MTSETFWYKAEIDFVDTVSSNNTLFAMGANNGWSYGIDNVNTAFAFSGNGFIAFGNFCDRGIFAGGYTGSNSAIIDFVYITTDSNAFSFGNLRAATTGLAGCGNIYRSIFAGGNTTSVVKTMDYIQNATNSTSASYGDLNGKARAFLSAASNNTYGLFAGGFDSDTSYSDTIDISVIATLASSSNHGNLTVGRNYLAGCSNPIFAIFAGGYLLSNSNVMDYVNFATSANALDWGDLTASKRHVCSFSSYLRGLWAGGTTTDKIKNIDYKDFATKANASNFGNLSTETAKPAGCSNKLTGIIGGGSTSSGYVTTIEKVTMASAGNAASFGNLDTARDELAATCGSNGGLQCFTTYYDLQTRGLIGGSGTLEYIDITTKSNSATFGTGFGLSYGACCGNHIRSIAASGSSIEYVHITTLSNSAAFGNLSTTRSRLGGASNRTLSVFAGGYIGTNNVSSVMDYITTATLGNASATGNLSSQRAESYGSACSTIACFGGGENNMGSGVVMMDYFTFSTLGNATNFGNMVSGPGMNQNSSSTSNSIYCFWAGGWYNPGAHDIIQRVTFASLSNASDHGNLTVGRSELSGGISNATRGIHCGGRTGGIPGTAHNEIDFYDMLASSNAIDFGDLQSARKGVIGISGSHGGLQG